MDDRTGGIKEMTIRPSGEGAEVFGQRFTGQRPRGQHGDLIVPWQSLLFTPLDGHQRMLIQRFSESGAVSAAVDGQGSSCGHGMGVRGFNHQGAQAPHFFLQQPCSPIAAQGTKTVAADQLSEITAVMGRRTSHRTHLNDGHRNAGSGHLPGRLGTGEACPQHCDGSFNRQQKLKPAAFSLRMPALLGVR